LEFIATPDGGTQVIHRVRTTNRGKLSLFLYRVQRRGLSRVWRRWERNLLTVIVDDEEAATAAA
jgi:hypothetical protein